LNINIILKVHYFLGFRWRKLRKP